MTCWDCLDPSEVNLSLSGIGTVTLFFGASSTRQVDSSLCDRRVLGAWTQKAACSSSRNDRPPEDFLNELGKNKKAQTFFEALN
jgi:hypothetical protein